MSYDEEFLLELHRYCNEGDYTDAVQLGRYVSRYSELCEETNRVCQKLQDLLQRGMLMEAREFFASQKPSLQSQIKELSCEDFTQLANYASMMGLPRVPVLSNAVLSEYQSKISESRDVLPLIQQYRKALAAKDSVGQLRLARQICECQPNDKEWQKTLSGLEEKQQQMVMEQAKNAIIQKDYTSLSECLNFLQEEAWAHPVRPEVLGKMRRVLHEHALEEVDREVKGVLNELEDLYQEDFENNLEAMQEKFEEIDRLLDSESDFQLDEPESSRLMELRGMWSDHWTRYQQDRARQEEYRMQTDALEGALAGNATPEKLDEIFDALQRTGLPISEELQQRYRKIREIRTVVRNRHRVLRSIVIVLILVVLGISTVLFLRHRHRMQLLDAFEDRVLAVLQDPCQFSGVAEDMFSDMEAQNPWVKETPEFADLHRRLLEKHAKEEELRVQVSGIADDLTRMVANYEENRDAFDAKLRALDALSLYPELEKIRQDVHQACDAAQKGYISKQEREYTILVGKGNDTLSSITMHGFPLTRDACVQAVKQIDKCLADIDSLQNVSQEVKNRYASRLANLQDSPANIYISWADTLAAVYEDFMNGKTNRIGNSDVDPFLEFSRQLAEIRDFAAVYSARLAKSDKQTAGKVKELQDLGTRLEAFRAGFAKQRDAVWSAKTQEEFVRQATDLQQRLPKCLNAEYEEFLTFYEAQVKPLATGRCFDGASFGKQLEEVRRDYTQLGDIVNKTALRLRGDLRPACQIVFMESKSWPGAMTYATSPICYYMPEENLKNALVNANGKRKRIEMKVLDRSLTFSFGDKDKRGPVTVQYGDGIVRENLWPIVPRDEKGINALVEREGEGMAADHWFWLRKYGRQGSDANPRTFYDAFTELMKTKHYRTDSWMRLWILNECLRDMQKFAETEASVSFKRQRCVRALRELHRKCEEYCSKFSTAMEGDKWMLEANLETENWISLRDSFYELWGEFSKCNPDEDIATLKRRQIGNSFRVVGVLDMKKRIVNKFDGCSCPNGCGLWVWDSKQGMLVEVGRLRDLDSGDSYIDQNVASEKILGSAAFWVVYGEN